MITRAEFRDGQRSGQWLTWTDDARRVLIDRESYRGGRAHGPTQRWDPETGRLVREGQYDQGVAVGVWSQWAPDGTLLGTFDLGPDGSGQWQAWYDNGQLKLEGWYEAGRHVGFWSYYRDDGFRLKRCEVLPHDREDCETFEPALPPEP